MPKKKFWENEPLPEFKTPLIAKKDFKIVHNDYVREIKKGDDVSDVPEMYLNNLKIEGII